MISSNTLCDIMRVLDKNRPTGILTDIDGTISEISSSPGAATVDPEARTAIEGLAGHVELVAVVTGRSAVDAVEMVGTRDIVYAGNHGMEWWIAGSLERSNLALEHIPKIEAVLNRLRHELDIEGVLIENKGLTGSVHVRQTADPLEAEQQVLRMVEHLCEDAGLRVTRGQLVIEIRPPVDLDKGSAVRDLVDRFKLRSGVYFGDDVTDVDAFKAFTLLRQEQQHNFYSIGVTGESTPDSVVHHADYLVDGVNGVTKALECASRILRGDAN